MEKLLYIQASPRSGRSKSTMVAQAFLEVYKKTHLEDLIEILNVFNETIPDFDGPAVQAKYTIMHGQKHSSKEAAAWKAVEKVIQQFKSADKYLISIPMWNFSIPYRLKQYIDILVQPGYTFTYDQQNGYQGLVKNKPILTVYARGGEYAEGTGGETFDLQKKYIELILGFIGFTDIQTIIVEPTLHGSPDVVEEKLEQAIKKAQQLAQSF